MADVFISHSSKDKEIADKVCAYLEANGFRCWIAPRDIIPGSEWPVAISDAISSVKAMIVIYSQNSATSTQVPKEITLASKRDKLIIPYKIDDTELEGAFDYFLAGAHWINADSNNGNYKLDELCNVIEDSISAKTEYNLENTSKLIKDSPKKVKKAKSKKKIIILTILGIVSVPIIVLIVIVFLFIGLILIGLSSEDENDPNIVDNVNVSEEELDELYLDLYEYDLTDEGAVILKYNGSESDIEIPEQIKGKPVKKIERGAFYQNKELISVDIPDSVTSIGAWAFAETGLKNVTMPQGLLYIEDSAFYLCSDLESIKIPDKTIYIGAWAFAETGINEITIPDNITAIYDSTFYNCSNLRDVSLPISLTHIGPWAFACSGIKEISIPDSVLTIEYCAFKECTLLASVELPVHLPYISNSLFYGCSNLTEVKFPDDVMVIEAYAFAKTPFVNISLAEYPIYQIGLNAFRECPYLESVELPDTLAKLDKGAFMYCDKLNNIVLPDAIRSVAPDAFLYSENVSLTYKEQTYSFSDIEILSELLYEELATDYEYALADGSVTITNYVGDNPIVVIPDVIDGAFVTKIDSWTFDENLSIRFVSVPCDMEIIGNEAFYGCENLELVVGGENVEVIGSGAFFMTNIKKVFLPEKVSVIEYATFGACNNLTDVNIPEGVTTINENAFAWCNNLVNVTIPVQVTSVMDNAFDTSLRTTVFYCEKHYSYDEISELPILVATPEY